MAILSEEKKKIIKEFALHDGDTGSTEVQVALETKKIHFLTGHCQSHPKDFSSRRGLLKAVCRRRRLLQYLERTDSQKYKEIIGRLDLRK